MIYLSKEKKSLLFIYNKIFTKQKITYILNKKVGFIYEK